MQIKWNTKRASYFYFILLGVIVGILINNLIAGGDVCSIIQTDNLKKIRDANYSGWLLLFNILKKRLSFFVLLGIIATAYQAVILLKITLAYVGGIFGYIVSSCVISYGIKGVMLIIVGTFPQLVFYIPAGIAMIIWCDRQVNDYELSLEQIKLFALILGVVIIGCVTESYVNPILLTKFLKNF